MGKIKNFIASCVFVLILGLLMFVSTQLLKPGTGEYIQQPEFYQLSQNSLDFVAIGSSHAYCTFDPAQLETATGLKSFTFASAALSFPGRLSYLKEMYKTQNPKVIYMDATGVDLANEVFEKHRHENFTYLPISMNRYEGALKSVRANLWEEMVFPLKLYHSNWTNFTGLSVKQAIFPVRVGKKGYVRLTDANPIRFSQDSASAQVSIDKKKLDMFDQIAEITAEHKTKLVLFAAPLSMKDQGAYMQVFKNRYKDYKNITYLDMNQWVEAAGLDADKDFYDSNHLNADGVTKITPFIGEHIRETLVR